MHKIITLIFLSLILPECNANFLTHLLGISSGKHTSHKIRRYEPAHAPDNSATVFRQYCTIHNLVYGRQIICKTPEQVTNFKLDASATVRCKQKYHGVSEEYPATIQLSSAFLQSFNQCNGEIHGPNIISNSAIREENPNLTQQINYTSTYYDIVCGPGFESIIYLKQQQSLHLAMQESIEHCIKASEAPDAKGFLYTFLIFVVVAITAFGIIIRRVYHKRQKTPGK
jgi:hypothetical protein